MYNSKDLKKYFQYWTEAMPKSISIEQFCSRNMAVILAIKTTLSSNASISWRIQDICIIPMLAHSFLALWRMF